MVNYPESLSGYSSLEIVLRYCTILVVILLKISQSILVRTLPLRNYFYYSVAMLICTAQIDLE